MSKEICSNCAYGIEEGTDKGVYRACKRYPQKVTVLATSFCGEFKPKPKKKAKDGK